MVVKIEELIFGYDYEGKNVAWTWDVEPLEKIFWKTWKPKLTNVKILSKFTDHKLKQLTRTDIYESVIAKQHPPKP